LLTLYLLAPLLVLVGGWLIWKLRFYGSVLPNTFYVKVASLNSLKRGVFYVYLFFYSYWLVLFPILFLIFARKLFHQKNQAFFIISILIALWLVYVIAVGGDFMEFRFIVPVLPFVFIQIVWLIFVQLRGIKLRLALVLLVLCGALQYVVVTNPLLRYYDIESTRGLSDLLTQDRTDWIGIGKVLGESFNYDPQVSIAVTAAGAIPYYSRLTSVDILGLNDKWVARHGEIVASKPGHQRRATLDYLIERKVNLLIGHPQMVSTASDISEGYWNDYYFYVKITPQDALPENARILEIPINAGYKLRALYLTENPQVEAVIQKKHWITYPVLLTR
jgi:arabinofuranosyltransferase